MTDTPLEQLPAEAVPPEVGQLAETLGEALDAPRTVQRVGVVTAVETTGSRRVQVDIAASTWLNRLQDTMIQVGDRVSVLQQDGVMLVIGRLTGTDAFSPIGTILPYAGSAAPTNWLLCDGAAVSRTTYAALFAVCGTAYGAGNGTTTFNVPNLAGRMPMGVSGTYTRGSTGGAATVTLTEANLASHDHSLSAGSTDTEPSHSHSMSGSVSSAGDHSHSVGNQGGRSDLLATGGTSAATSGGGSTGSAGSHSHSLSGSIGSGGSHSHTLSGNTSTAGSGTAHENLPPYQAVTYIVRAA